MAVHAHDRVTRLGVISILAEAEGTRVLTGAEHAEADADVVVSRSVGDAEFALLRDIRERRRRESPRCVLVTDHFRPACLMSALECGVAAVLSRRTTTVEELVGTVLAVGQGEAVLPPALPGALLMELNRVQREVLEPNGLSVYGPSARERDVLRLLADGHGDEEIAARLKYSERTIKNVLYGMMTRLGLTTRAHAVAFALRAGLI